MHCNRIYLLFLKPVYTDAEQIRILSHMDKDVFKF